MNTAKKWADNTAHQKFSRYQNFYPIKIDLKSPKIDENCLFGKKLTDICVFTEKCPDDQKR
jgi:hypothetical protein